MIQRCIPPLTTVTAETGPLDSDYAACTWTKFHGFHVLDEKPFDAESMSDEEARNQAGEWPTMNDDHPFSTLWAIHLDTGIGRWCVVGRLASIALRASKLRIDSLGLDLESDYLVFDFWKQEFLGRVRAQIDCPALPLGHCQVLAVRPALDRPQLLSSSRHISQDAVSVKAQSWAADVLTLELAGVGGTSETYWIHVPPGFRPQKASGKGLTVEAGVLASVGEEDAAWPLRVDLPGSRNDRAEASLTVEFTRG
jgi:alpha-galactosidase